MTDTESLLAAIHAAPNEDVPRLMLADEIALHDEQRAEFIRLSVELARRDPYDPPADLVEIAASGRLYSAMARMQIAEAEAAYDAETTAKQRLQSVLLKQDWRPICPVCTGKGYVQGDIRIGIVAKYDCLYCDTVGHIGKHERGLLLTLPVRQEWLFYGVLNVAGQVVKQTHELTGWTKHLHTFPEIRSLPLLGKAPWHSYVYDKWMWLDNDNGEDPGTDALPRFIFDALPGEIVATGHPERLHKRYDSKEEAIDALGTTVRRLIYGA